MGRTIFLSYSRSDGKRVRRLEETLDSLDHGVWRDRRLSGGQAWWQEILDSVCAQDTFLLAVSPSSLRSLACQRELHWALALHKPVLPVLIAGDDAAMPPAVQHLQYVDYRDGTGPQVAALSRALALLPPGPSPGGPEPERPAAPPAKPVARAAARLGWMLLAALALAGSAALVAATGSSESDPLVPVMAASASSPTPAPLAPAEPVGGSSGNKPTHERVEPAQPPPARPSTPSTRRAASPAANAARPDPVAERARREIQDYVARPPFQLEPEVAASLAQAWVDECRATDVEALRRAATLRLAVPARLPGARCQQQRMAIQDVACLRSWLREHLPRCPND